jgi:hypothetical protein
MQGKQTIFDSFILIRMATLKYTVISSARQYDNYCRLLEELVFANPKTKALKDEIELLTLLI